MSDSARPHRQQPTRLPCLWDSPGKNTGVVGCHFLLHCMKGKRESEVARSCPTPSEPMDCSPPGSSVRGIFQARRLEWGAVAFSSFSASISDSSKFQSSVFLVIQDWKLTLLSFKPQTLLSRQAPNTHFFKM